MNYEQEYKKALERARIWQKHLNENGDNDYAEELSYIFSELKKEENERIRKAIIALVKQSSEILAEQNQNNMIAWLENQELKCNPYSGVSFKYNNHTWGMCARDGGVEVGIDGQLKAFVSSDKSFVYPTNPIPDIKPKSALEAVKEEKADSQNCVNPADKVEAKFHEGEWVIFNENNNSVYQVERIDNYRYYLRHYLGGTLSVHFDNELIRLWTIQDAKKGDVLACNKEILLFKSYSEQGHISLYCWYNGQTNNFWSKEVVNTLLTKRNKIWPATKEQRDTLYKAIADAGYTFDLNKKELKKIEQKPQRTISAEAKEALYDKFAWSEEDEYNFNTIYHLLDLKKEIYKKNREEFNRYNILCKWFKSLKNR